MKKILKDRTEVKVRFGEVDSMGIVWHGNYVKYIEEGRESFGKKYGISYLDIYAKNVMAPVVSMKLDFKKQINAIVTGTILISATPTKAHMAQKARATEAITNLVWCPVSSSLYVRFSPHFVYIISLSYILKIKYWICLVIMTL